MPNSKSPAAGSASGVADIVFAASNLFVYWDYFSIIAMKGLPFTRKTEFATLIAAHLRCPILSLEHFLDVLEPPSSPHQPQDLAFRIVCGMANHHLSYGVFNKVVIDSPLSSASHLHQLTELASSLSPKPARVVIVECKPMNVYLWQMKFEEHIARNPDWARKWYKPKNWEDMEKEIKVNHDYDECHNLAIPQISQKFVTKLVIDPLLDEPVDNLYDEYQKSYKIPRKAPHLIEAIEYMISRKAGDGSRVVVYQEWKQSKHLSSSSSSYPKLENQSVESLKKQLYCRHGHNISNSTLVEGIEHEEANCMACQKQVIRRDDAYTCKDCTLALHKECAESFDKYNTWGSPFPKTLFSTEFHFPKEFACNPCKEDGKGFSDKCASCLFKTHLNCRLMPTVIKHVDTEEHFLTIMLLPTLDCEVYRCVACGGSDKYNLYLCMICGVAYHNKCVTLPRRVEDVHGGHHHHLSLKFSSQQAEDYICNECLERRDPGLWFYSCEECPYEVHPSCVFGKKEEE